MKSTLLIALFALLPLFTLNANEYKPFSISGTQVVPIQDSKNKRQYELYIKLPKSYTEDTAKRYPVIYFTDALWHMELLSGATYFLLEDIILVGISWQTDIAEQVKAQEGVHFSRYRDYSIKPSKDVAKQAKYQLGQASEHLAFIKNDVFSYVEKTFRTKPQARSYFGFSLGGLFGTYALLTQPDMFKNYILGSPSIWRFAPELFAQQSANLKNKNLNINVFISYGEQEKELSGHIDEFVTTLKSQRYPSISKVEHVVIDAAGHSDSFPIMGAKSIKWLSSLN
ncbi:alpha/beta hydrolase [Pseudoalteromonas sp. JBTF-M23]|uniref:Alpha/beta hydrolase n=1 Tax=Pseudoalteromonas caenipelagi TaxID=2726988 RepID=A0A849VFK0_9GAMM|nr:alpha/beta hydrolase-fold protein [Pseudoalteromonas caenipelagi]NOU51955.1 alpha/beta hydrolase [Pseudoalteromonas caenipelagi]